MPRSKTEEILTKLECIDKKLGHIEGKVDGLSFSANRQLLASFGFGFAIASFAWISQNFRLFIFFFVIGLIVLLLARFLPFLLPKQSKP